MGRGAQRVRISRRISFMETTPIGLLSLSTTKARWMLFSTSRMMAVSRVSFSRSTFFFLGRSSLNSEFRCDRKLRVCWNRRRKSCSSRRIPYMPRCHTRDKKILRWNEVSPCVWWNSRREKGNDAKP